jgi:polysaccharide chain length determinant protein (PEP-CTERM system associated)
MLPGKAYKPEDVLQILRRRIWFLLVPFAIVSGAVAAWSYKLPDRYRSETVILVVPQRVPESYVRSTVTTRIEDRLQSLSQQIMSRTRLERIIQDFNLYEKERKTGIMEDIVERMRRDINLQVVRGDAFRIDYEGDSPRTVMKVTERLASLFIEESLRDRETLAEGTNQFLEAQLEDARRRLIEHEKKLEEYKTKYAGQLPSQTEANLQVLQNSQLQIQNLTESINRDRDQRVVLERAIADLEQQEEAAAASGATPAADGGPVTPAQQLAGAKARLAILQTRFKADHPEVKKQLGIIRDLEKQVADAAEGAATPVTPIAVPTARSRRLQDYRLQLELMDRNLAKKQADEQRLRAQVASYQGRVEAAPARESEMTELNRDYKTLQDMYTGLLAKKEDSKIAANLERRQIGEQFKLLDPARLPERPFSPNRQMLNFFGLGGGIGAGLLLIALLEYRDSSFKTDHEVMRVLSLPVLAIVPLMQSPAEKKWAFRKRLMIAGACSVTVAAGLGVVAYTFIF